ncbi:MAG TPA: NAD-dependent epimerase/dehydratase family protein [Coriobacteriia bacterium]
MKSRYLITGGAGFIGSNVAHHYLSQGCRVTIVDNFARRGSRDNAAWLRSTHGRNVTVVEGDISRTDRTLQQLVEKVDVVFHLAAQVAVTTSVIDPRLDFQVNALGTFNVLEAVRASSTKPILIYASTNKVYGELVQLEAERSGSRYVYRDCPHGVGEAMNLDFHSPYGCSKGTGDQYVLDYARIYGLRTVAFRQSCIYGPHQFGMEDQGWVAWFALRALKQLPVTIFGDGQQVRDVLHVYDLIRAYDAAIAAIDRTSGQAFNIGGGPANTLSLLELIRMLEVRLGHPVQYSFDEWRPGDQRIYVSDIRKARERLAWEPQIVPEEGIRQMIEWLAENEHRVSFANDTLEFVPRPAHAPTNVAVG